MSCGSVLPDKLCRIQAKLGALAPSEDHVSDELIAERRAEAERE